MATINIKIDINFSGEADEIVKVVGMLGKKEPVSVFFDGDDIEPEEPVGAEGKEPSIDDDAKAYYASKLADIDE